MPSRRAGSAAEQLGQRPDKTDGAAAADGDWLAAKALAHGIDGRLERWAGRIGHPPFHRLAVLLDRDAHAPRRIGRQHRLQLLVNLLRILVGHNPATDDGAGARQHLIRGALDRTGFLGDDRDGRLAPGLLVDAGVVFEARWTPGRMPRSSRSFASSPGRDGHRLAFAAASAAAPCRKSAGSAAGRCPSTAAHRITFSASAASASAPPAMPLWTGKRALNLDHSRAPPTAALRG